MRADVAESGAYSTVAPVHPHANPERGEKYPAVPIVTVAVELHVLIDAIRQSSGEGREIEVGGG
ncbi:MAG: hypothetical protein IIB26_07855 [Chloroflexi bacterium]|nr:hypothetical protein [Chloroflexota bacterium]